MSVTVIHGDAVAVLPTLALEDAVIITDPPWPSGRSDDVRGVGLGAVACWERVLPMISRARAVVIFQSRLDAPLIPVPYRGRRLMGHVAYVYGAPPLPPGRRCWAAQCNSVTTRAGAAERRTSGHPMAMSMTHARWLVSWFAHGCHVVDPFAGGGSILRAAAEAGQPATGIEIDERWLAGARVAIRDGERQMRLAPEAAHA